MKIPYQDETEIITVLILVSIIAFSYYIVTSMPDPTIYPVTPTLLWEICNVVFKISLLLMMSWPSSLPIWLWSIVYIIDCLVVDKSENKKLIPEFDVEKYLASKGFTMDSYSKAKTISETVH